jgi:site-specific DNA-methyltransferase (adenine-specific)
MSIELLNGDCMDYMRGLPDKAFSLAICDPPYGIGISSNPVRQQHTKKAWDAAIPDAEYFAELKRVSHNQIVWGGNYFLDYLGATQGFLIWDKVQPHDFSLAMCEMAWSSFQSPAKLWRRSVLAEQGKIHPTQKPVKLYEWLLANYAKPGDRILDTHGGSMSIAIACHNLGYDLTLCELDADYYKAGVARFEQHKAQGSLFIPDTPRDAYEQTDMLCSAEHGA